MRRVLIVFPLLGVLATGGFGQTNETDKVQNLRNCFAGFGECDRSLLTATQADQISAMQHDRNLWKCLREYGCDRSALSETELKEVAETERLRNLLACETALGVCDKRLLTASETEKVATLEKEVKLGNLRSLFFLCWMWKKPSRRVRNRPPDSP